jgi:hypothetical protein
MAFIPLKDFLSIWHFKLTVGAVILERSVILERQYFFAANITFLKYKI